MTITVSAAVAEYIQREIELGHASDPAEIIERAVSAAQASAEWTSEDRMELEKRLDHSLEQVAQGLTHSAEQARLLLAKDRAARGQ